MVCSGALWSLDFILNSVPVCKRRRLKGRCLYLQLQNSTTQTSLASRGCICSHCTPTWCVRCHSTNCVQW